MAASVRPSSGPSPTSGRCDRRSHVTGRGRSPPFDHSVAAADGPDYVFVKVVGKAGDFERRTVRIAHEGRGQVVIDEGLRAGEEVVRAGSLILAQAYEDL